MSQAWRRTAHGAALLLCGLAAGAATAAESGQDSLAGRAQQLLARAPIIDGHNDVAIRLRERTGGRLDSFAFDRLPDSERALWRTDIARLREGGVGAQFWSVYVPADLAGPEALRRTLEQIDLVKRLVARYPRELMLAQSADDIEKARAKGRIASLIGAEGGHAIADSLGVLRQLHALGVRYLTLTHSRTTLWADSATDAPRHGGLSPFGVAVVREMNRLGMLVDLSHVSAETMHDALDVSAAPVIFSHSSAYALTPHPRNVPDDVLARLPANGGLVMVSLIARATDPAVNDWAAAEEGERARLASLHPGAAAAVEQGLAAWRAARPRPEATVAEVADHIDHVRRIAGVRAIGIGSDFDGDRHKIEGLEDPSKLPRLVEELLRRGYSDADVALITRGNILRALRQAERTASRLQRERRPEEADPTTGTAPPPG